MTASSSFNKKLRDGRKIVLLSPETIVVLETILKELISATLAEKETESSRKRYAQYMLALIHLGEAY